MSYFHFYLFDQNLILWPYQAAKTSGKCKFLKITVVKLQREKSRKKKKDTIGRKDEIGVRTVDYIKKSRIDIG